MSQQETVQKPEPRDYQYTALENLEEARKSGKDTGLLVMATGTGKTLTAAFDIENYNPDKVLFLAHQQEIIKQAEKEFDRLQPEKSKGLYFGKDKEKDAEYLFATRQTLRQERHLKEFDRDEFDYIVVDEFHHAMSETYQKILDYFKPEFLLGLTATPFLIDVDEEDILDYLNLDDPTFRYETDEATERGDLAKFEAKVYKDNIDYDDAPGDLSESDLNKKLFLPERNKYIAEKWLEEAEGSKTIAFCRNIEHAERTSIHFSQEGVNAEAVHSEMPDTKRNKRIRKFRKGKIDVLATVDIFNEGVDFPSVETLVFMRPTMSERIFHQQLGRGLRNTKAKDKCLVLDFVNETDWNRLEWYGVSPSKTEYQSGKCDECGRESSELLENEDGENVCKQCRKEDVEIATGMGEIEVDVEALFDIAEEYQSYKFAKNGYSKEDLIEILRDLNEKVDGKLTCDHLKRFKNVPDRGTYSKYFGSFNEAKKKAGLELNTVGKIPKDKGLQKLQNLENKLDRPIRRKDVVESEITCGHAYYCKYWGSIKQAAIAADVDYLSSRRKCVENSKIKEDLHSVANKNDTVVLNSSDYEDEGEFTLETVNENLSKNNSWCESIRNAKLSPEHKLNKIDILRSVKYVTENLGTDTISLRKYINYSNHTYARSTINRHFENWSEAKRLAKRCVDENLSPEEVLKDEGYETEENS